MKVQKIINVSMSGNDLPQPVRVVAIDSAIQLVLRYVDFTIPDGTTATLYARKPSGKFVYQTNDITINGNVVTINLNNQVIAEDGLVPFQVELKNGTDTLTTFSNHFLVDRNYKNSDAEESKTVVTEFEKLLEDFRITVDEKITEEQIAKAVEIYITENDIGGASAADEVIYDDAETKLGATDVQKAISLLSVRDFNLDKRVKKIEENGSGNGVTVVNSTNEMIDVSAIYVLSADGHWYYYNGVMWTDGGEFTGATVSITQIQSAVEDYLEDNSQTMGTLTINGQTYDGSKDVDLNIGQSESKAIEKLTFTGAVEAEYDGSTPITVNIPSGGSDGSGYTLPVATSEKLGGVKPVPKTDSMTQEVGVDSEGKLYTSPTTGGSGSSSGGYSDWELIGEVTGDGTGDSTGIYVPVDFTQYKEVFIKCTTVASTILRVMLSSALAWYNGNNICANGTVGVEVTSVATPSTQVLLMQAYIMNVAGELYPFSGWQSGYTSGVKGMQPVANPRAALLETNFTYVRVDTNNNGAVPEGVSLSVYGRK